MLNKIELAKYIFQQTKNLHLDATKSVMEAQRLAIDLFDYIIFRQKISEEETYRAAAQFCSLPFSEQVPQNLKILTPITRLDDLGSLDSFSALLFDREVIFISPSADKILALSEQIRARTAKKMNICIVPKRALREGLIFLHKEKLLDESRQRLARRWPFASAHLDLTIPARIIFIMLIIFIISLISFAPLNFTPYLLPLLFILFILPAWFRFAALFELFYDDRQNPTKLLNDVYLPIYTILIPLRNEANMVAQLEKVMNGLDYPPEKLDVKFIVEQTSPKTLEAVKNILADNPTFELIEVPDSAPLTKPKALDFALPLVRGEYLVIYDAEDIPEASQLKIAATIFYNNPGIDCIQAELVIDNSNENWLTRLFAAEYSGLFGVMLPALSRWSFPMPLGGTSNHFRTISLLEVGGWDAFNVTEDADLGVRLSRLRYKSSTFNSRTYEEAPISLEQWMAQRTRWMKGWMQTFIVHNRFAGQFLRDAGIKNFLAFQIYVGSLIISAPLHTIFLIAIIVRLLEMSYLGFENSDGWIFIHIFVLIVGYGAIISHSIVGVLRLKRKFSFSLLTLPFYWGLNGIASFFAAYELFVRPYFWAKTKHGISKKRENYSKTNLS